MASGSRAGVTSPRGGPDWKPQFAVCTAKTYAEQARFWLVCILGFC